MPNRLASESSPYLKQHADNPVDWYPWGDEAFECARREGKPVLLSIGYSACHWCHVMAHESFEDEAVAAVMNELFINIKVDREERPDIDRIYQVAQQLITQQGGGWPLTMFLSADDRRPFFGGTYFPKEVRHGMPAFPELLQSVARYYREQPDAIEAQGEQLMTIFGQLDPPPGDGGLDAAPLSNFRERVAQAFDREYGGTGSAPKFPHPSTIALLMRRWRATANATEPDLDSLFMASLTLTRMAEGGLFDHVGGGFFRYSVDRYWQIPHFEKMLYDNGPLLACYAEAWLATGDELYRETAARTADWMLDVMQAGGGGFYSTLDADADGEEGRYYVWSPAEVQAALDEEDAALLVSRFGLDREANFEGRWHLAVQRDLKSLAGEHGLSVRDAQSRISAALAALKTRREQRTSPALDDKLLTSWNALAIRGLAIAGRALEREDLVDAAGRAADVLRDTLYRDGRLLATCKDGEARLPAYLDDYAFLVDALLELLQSRWNSDWLTFARELADGLLEHFEDRDAGGFFFTADDHEALIHRSKPLADEATPSGNGVTLFALQRLGLLLGETRYLDAAERGLGFAWKAMEDYPHGHATLLMALEDRLDYPETIIIRGDAAEANRWRHAANRLFAPRRQVFAIPADAVDLPGALADKPCIDGETLAYRCRGLSCDTPVTSWEALAIGLRETQEPMS